MVRVFTLVCFMLISGLLVAQQETQYTQYMLNKFAFNPAYAGMDNSLSFTGVYRNQWINLPGGPESQQVNAHMPLYFLGGAGGINIENDLAGVQRNTSASLAYSYWVPMDRGSLAIGVEGGIIQKSLDGSKLRTPEGTFLDGSYIRHNDNFLPAGIVSALVPTFNLGMYYKSQKLDVGISVNNLTEPKIRLDLLDGQNSEILYNRNYFLTLGLNFDIGAMWTLRPGVLAKSDLTQTETHFSTIVQYNDNIFVGASFRGYNSITVDALAFLAGLKLNERVTLSYSYDWTLSALNTVSRGSHEVLINYNLGKPIGKGLLPKIIYNPRYE